MKKVFFAIAALAILAIAGCSFFTAPTDESSDKTLYYHENGVLMVELDMAKSMEASRALIPVLAQAGTDFYEVVFVYDLGGGTKEYYRIAWREGTTARLRIPLGDYSNDIIGNPSGNKAYMFAGRYSDATLLAIGEIDCIYQDILKQGTGTLSGVAATEITSDSTRVVFAVTALETDVKNDAASTFIQTAPPYSQGITVISKKIQAEGDVPIPIFMLSAGATTVARFDLTAANKTALTTDLLDVIIVKDASVKPISRPYTYADQLEERSVDLANAQYKNLTIDTAIDFPITMDLTTEADNAEGKGGLCRLYFEIPVYLLDKGDVNGMSKNGEPAITWYFRGGLSNFYPDVGVAAESRGGAILLGCGNVLSSGGIIVEGGY